MYHFNLRNLIRTILDEDETEYFALWAFGDGYKDFDSTPAFMDAWNDRHKEDLELSPIGVPSDDIVKMIKLWRGK